MSNQQPGAQMVTGPADQEGRLSDSKSSQNYDAYIRSYTRHSVPAVHQNGKGYSRLAGLV